MGFINKVSVLVHFIKPSVGFKRTVLPPAHSLYQIYMYVHVYMYMYITTKKSKKGVIKKEA